MTPAGARPWRIREQGVRVLARVTPRSGRDGVDGVIDTSEGPALKVRVRAVAEDGEANRAVERVVAQWLGVPKTSVGVTVGTKSRIKTLDIAGEPGALAARIAEEMARLG